MEITVLSFNVLAQTWIDDELRRSVLDKRHLQRSYRVSRQIECMRRSNADVILLQEVTPIVLEHYKKRLPEYHVPTCFSQMHWQPATPDTPINGNAVLWRKGLFRSAQCQIVQLDKKLGNYAASLSAVTAVTGQHVKFISVHLEHGNFRAASAQFRNLFVQKHVNNEKRVIIGGDFNMGHPDWLIADYFKKRGFKDCVDPTTPTHPFVNDPYGQTIDHMLIRGFKCKDSKIAKCNSVGQCIKKYGSDHYPILVSMKLLG
jgi:endonuclease/exonuclease/phosphatase family metal-dependent hydrolase